MPVYMIQGGGERGPIKIGHSHAPEIRLIQIQISHWEDLRIIRQFVGGENEEVALHEKFADLHLRGEWHSWSPAMLGDVGLTEIFPVPAELPPAPESVAIPSAVANSSFGKDLRALRASKGITQADLAVLVGVSRPTIAMIEAGHDLPGRNLLMRISSYFGVPFTLSGASA